MSSNLFVPIYEVWVKGTKLGEDRKKCINSVSVCDTVEGADTCSIDISDPDFVFIEDNIFVEKSSLRVEMGFEGCTTRQEFDGYISAVDISFPNDGVPKLKITGMDKTHLMNRTKKNKTWNNVTHADIVKNIAKSYGFKCVVESGYNFKKHESVSQSNQTDADFIQSLAKKEIYPFTCRLVGDTIYYVKKGKLSSSVMTLHYLEYPHEIISFSPQVNVETRQEETETSSVNNDKTTSPNESMESKPYSVYDDSGNSSSVVSDNTKTEGSNTSSSSGKKESKVYDFITKTWV